MARFKIGDVVTFNYELGTDVHDDNPEVLVLHSNWECHPSDTKKRCLHGLNIGYLPQQHKSFIRAVVNEEFGKMIRQKDPVIDSWLKRIDHVKDLTIFSPYDFYLRFIRGYIQPRGWEPYRRYRLDKIRTPRILQPRKIYVGANPGRLSRFAEKFEHARGKVLNFFGK